eukprot:gene20114-22085_t
MSSVDSLDINECKSLVGGTNPCRCYGAGCENVCQNTIGSFRCKCGRGYKLTVWKTCVDRNECIETPDVCPQKCINTPGSYKCQCWNGFRWNREARQCQEINECSIGNGGCEHNCHNVYGGHVCSCRNGFYLADDRFRCIDLNECNGPTECDTRTSTCINTPGDYYCKCKNGFKFSQYAKICIDRDECEENTALCNQKCQNAFGSYRCSCEPGFYLSSDKITCKDVDECAQGKCDQLCLNIPGSYTCFCKDGYMLDVDGKSCKPKLCEAISAPFFGKISCNGNTVGKICRFSCNKGYHLDIKSPRQCLPSGRWSIRQPRCIPNGCGVPRPPPNGKLLLPCDQSYGSTCPVSCNRGYVLRGPSLLKCEIQGSNVRWDSHNVRCEEILVCKPNPCQFGGRCRILSPTEYACNCSGTKHMGQNCDIGFVSVPRFPKIRVNQRTAISLSANPMKYVSIVMYPDDQSVNLSPKSVTIRNADKTAEIWITGRQGGIKALSYELISEEAYTTPKQSMFLVYNQAELRRSKVNSLTGQYAGCYETILRLKMTKCSPVTIKSTEPWSLRRSGKPTTNGLVILQIKSARFPLGLPGVDISEVFSGSSNTLKYRITPRRRSCATRSLTTGQMQYVGKLDVFASDFLKQFNRLMPAWFSVGISERLQSFSEDNIRAFVWSGETLLAHSACSSLAIDRTGDFLVYLHHENIELKVHGKTLRIKTPKTICLAVDLCRLEPHLQLPGEHISDVISLFSFQELSAFGWKLSIKSIGFVGMSKIDTRECLRKYSRAGPKRIIFGDADIKYKNKHGVSALAKGDLVLAFKLDKGKEVIDLSSSCMDGNSLVETPTWKATDRSNNIYSRNLATNVVNFIKGPSSNRQSVLSMVQRGGSVFQLKSGMRPVIGKSSRHISVDFKYKKTEASVDAAGDNNFNKFSNLELLSFVVVDLEMAMESVQVSGSAATAKVSQLKSRISTWSLQLQSDVEALMLDIDNSRLIGDKARINYYKANDFQNALSQLVKDASIGSGVSFDAVKKSQKEMKVILDELKKSVKTADSTNVFHTLTLSFNSSMCLFKPCMSNLPVTLHPQSTDVTKQGFCHDASKTPFQMWNTMATVFGSHQLGKFFKFSTGDKFFLCLSVEGVKKGKLGGTLSFLGNSLKSEFVFEKPKIKIPETDHKVFGTYSFRINGSVDATLNKWDMMTVGLYGKAQVGSRFVTDLQSSMDRISIGQFDELRSKQKEINRKLVDLETKNGYLRSKLYSDQQIMRGAVRRLAEAKRRFSTSKNILDQQRKIFGSRRREFENLSSELNKVCTIKKCPLQCVQMMQCNVCQGRLYGNKTIPKCKTTFQTRSYSHKESYESTCSHTVEDRRLKYTGNCKEPQLEANARKRILEALQKKQKNNQTLTIEDALNLELVNKKSGQALLKAIQKRNFFKAFPNKLQNGRLTEAELERLKGYTNSSFAEKIRKHLKGVKLQLLIKELGSKMQQGQKLTDEDYDRVKKLDPKVAKQLKSNEAMREVFLKIKTGKTLSEVDLKTLKAANPEYYENYTRARDEREVFMKIERKLQKGNISAADIDELTKINPTAAAKLKDALKEQMLKKVNEMKSKMSDVKNSLDSGFVGGNISSLSDKLSQLTKNVKPMDRTKLLKLQEKIKQALATKGSVFEEVLERFDLALQVQNITGGSSDLKRTVNAFFLSLRRFDLRNIFKQSQNLISDRLQDLQRWFETAAKFLEILCAKCGQKCNNENTVQQVLSEVKSSIGRFESVICQVESRGHLKIDGIKDLCQLVKKAKRFSNAYITRKSKDCNEIKSKLSIELNNIAKAWKNLRNSNDVLFDKLWKGSQKAKSTINSYLALTNSVKNAVKRISSKIELPLPKKQELDARITRIIRPGNFRLRDTEYLVVLTSIKAFKDAIKLMPVNAKTQPSMNVNIPRRSAADANRKLKRLLDALPATLSALCSRSWKGSPASREEEMRLRNVLRVVEREFQNMLSSTKLSTFFGASQRFASVLEHSLGLAQSIKTKKLKCIENYQPPLADLDVFLTKVQSFDFRDYKDIAKGIKSTLNEIGSGIRAPIGKLMDYFEKIAIDTPSFDLPLMLTMSPDYLKLSMSSLGDYLQMVSKAFTALIDISDRCKKCKLEEVFGKYNLKAIAEKLDNKFKGISSKLNKFLVDTKFNPKGSMLFITSMEQIRTDLQRMYKSETGLDKESLKEIADTFKTAQEATELLQKGHFGFILKFAGTGSKEIFTIVNEMTALKKKVLLLKDKSKGSLKDLEALHSRIKFALSEIPSISGTIKDLKKGSVEKRLEIIENSAGIVKDLIKIMPKIYRDARSRRYFETKLLPAVGKHLDKIEEAKGSLFTKTQRFLDEVGLTEKAEALGIKGFKTNAKPQRRYTSLLRKLQASPANRRRSVLRDMERKATADENLITKFTNAWKRLYEQVTGKVDEIKAKVLKLRNKFDKYAAIFKDVQNTVEEIKKGPLSEVGKIKDSIETFSSTFEDYDLKKIMTSSPEIMKRKLMELKRIFQLSGNVLDQTDSILKKCKSCSIEKVFGYRFIKNFAGKFGQKFEEYHNYLEDFADKFSSGVSEVQNMTRAVGKIRDRFKNVFKDNKFGSNMLKDLAHALRSSSGDVNILKDSGQELSNILLGQDVDLQMLRGSYDGLVSQLGQLLEKTAIVAKKVDAVYCKANGLRRDLAQLDAQVGSLKQGPLQTRIRIATNISSGVKAMIQSLPAILESTDSALKSAGIDSDWISRFAAGLSTVTGKLEKVLGKTDAVLNASGILLAGKQDVSKQFRAMKENLRELKEAPWINKLNVARAIASNTGNMIDTALSSIESSANALNIDFKREDLLNLLPSDVNRKRLAELSKISRSVLTAVDELQKGPISEIGKLTDSVETFVDGLKGFDIGKAILSDPASLKEKIAEFQQLADGTADILTSISSITGVCKNCDINNIIGKGFMKKVSKSIAETFNGLHKKVKDIGRRVKLGHSGWNKFVATAEKISDGFNGVIKNKKITPETFRSAAKQLRDSATNVQTVKDSSADIFKAIFNDDEDMKKMQEKFEGLVGTMSSVMNKTAVFSDDVEAAYETVNGVRNTFKAISNDFDNLKKGPLDTRVLAVRNMVAGVRNILKTMPRLLNESRKVGSNLGIDSRWIGKISNDLSSFTQGIESVFDKTDLSLQDAGIAVQNFKQITDASKAIADDFKSLSSASTGEKFNKINNIIAKVDGIFGSAINATTAVDSILQRSLNIDLNITSGLSKITDSASGLINKIGKGVKHVQGIYKDIVQIADDIKSGPVKKVGALTDSVEDFVKSMKNFNIAEILVMSPKFATKKLADVKDIIEDSGAILKSISSVVSDVCPTCNMSELFGNKFFTNIKKDLTSGFNKLVGNATKFLNKVGDGAEGVLGIVNSVSAIENQLNGLKGIKLNTEGINKLAGIMDSSSSLVGSIGGNTSKKAGKLTSKVEDAFAKVDEVKKSFDDIGKNFGNLGEGPVEERVKAAKNIVSGVMSITSGLPDLLNSASLGLESTSFLRRFGTQLSEVTEGVNKVLQKTNGIITDVGTTVEGISNIGRLTGSIGNTFQQMLRAPTAQKFRLVQKTIGQIKDLTGEVNKFTGGVSDAVEKLTGKTLLSTSLFGNSTQKILGDISSAVGIVADRYEQFQELTKTFSKAFKDISADPIDFAINELPKLLTQTEGFLKTIIGDTKAVANKLGLKLDNVNLDPALVSTAKQFYGFAKGALGTYQNGKQLFTDFKNLFNSKDFKSGLANLQKLTVSGKKFITSLDALGETLFKEKWTGIKGDFTNMVDKVGDSFGINLQKAGDLFNKGMSVAGDAFGIYSDIKTLFNIKEFTPETLLKSATAVVGIANKAVSIMNTFGANIQTKALQSVSKFLGTATAVFQIAKGIYDFVGWVNDVCDITYETKIIRKEISYICLKTRVKVESIKIPIDECKYETVKVRRGYGSANFCCNGTKCVYLQKSACLSGNDACVQKRISFVKASSKFERNLAEAYEKFETAELAMAASQMDIKAVESLKKRYQIAYNQTLALYRINRIDKSRTLKNQAVLNLAVWKLKALVNQNANTSTLLFETAEFNVDLYTQDEMRIPLTVSYKDQAGLRQTVDFTMDFSNAQKSFEHTVKWMLAKLTEYSIPRRRGRSVNRGGNKVVPTSVPMKCKAFAENLQLFTDIIERLKSSVENMFTGRSFSRLKRSRDVKMSKTLSEARHQLVKELILLSSSARKNLRDIIGDWMKDSELKISQALDGRCNGFSDCVKTLKEEMMQLFDAGLSNYKYLFSALERLAQILIDVPTGRLFEYLIRANVNRGLSLLGGLSDLKSLCHNAPTLSKLPSTIVAYKGMELELDCPAKSASQYQWFVNKTALPGFNGKILSITDIDDSHEGSYYCQASNAAGTARSDAVFVKVAEKLAFVEQLQDVAMPETNQDTVALSCNVTTLDGVTFSWWKQSLSGRVRKLRKKTAFLDLGKGTRRTRGIYWCEASNGYASIRSRKATVALVESVRRHHSVQLEIDLKSTNDFMVCKSPTTQQLSGVERSLKDLFEKGFAFKNTRKNISVGYFVAKKNMDAKILTTISIIPLSRGGKTDEELALEDSKLQVKMRKVINSFWDNEDNIKFKFGDCIFSLVESTAIVTWDVEYLNCPTGMGLTDNNLRCLSCLPGNFDNGMSRCKQCPMGSYQPRFGQSSCIPCGNGQLTPLAGNLDASTCTKSDFNCYNEMKIMIAVDTSTEVGQQGLGHTKKFLREFVSSFDISEKTAQFSLATFDDAAKLHATFGTSASGIRKAITGLRDIGRTRRTDLALDLAENVFVEGKDKTVRQALVIVSHGPRKFSSYFLFKSKADALKEFGVEVFYVAVGSRASGMEATIASSSPKEEHVFKIPNIRGSEEAASVIGYAVCTNQ